jgi:NADPH:quinone reductase-like Zn-dependent oxidoreductase
MKVAIAPAYGPPEVVRVTELPIPEPKADEIRIRVRCATVNRTDCGFRSAEYGIVHLFGGLFKPKNPVLGCEYAGEVEEVGRKVTRFAVGDRVFGFDDLRFGSHAEYRIAKETDAMARIPAGISFETAAAITEGAHYALCDLRAAKLQAGQRILINGTTGAIGSASVQLAKHLGAHVTAVCDTKNLDRVAALGADVVVDYLNEDIVARGGRYDIVFDAVGKRRYRDFISVMDDHSVFMSSELGPGAENVTLALKGWLFRSKKRVLFPIPSIDAAMVAYLGDLTASGAFTPIIDRSYALDEIVEAYRYVETGMKTGNVLLVP